MYGLTLSSCWRKYTYYLIHDVGCIIIYFYLYKYSNICMYLQKSARSNYLAAMGIHVFEILLVFYFCGFLYRPPSFKVVAQRSSSALVGNNNVKARVTAAINRPSNPVIIGSGNGNPRKGNEEEMGGGRGGSLVLTQKDEDHPPRVLTCAPVCVCVSKITKHTRGGDDDCN